MNENYPPNYDSNGIDQTAIQWALGAIPLGAERYAEAQRYYDGDHETAFATEKWQNAFGRLFRKLRLNICPVIVDTLKDRLKVKGFVFVTQESEEEENETDEFGEVILPLEVQKTARKVEIRTKEIWRRNRMKKRLGELVQEALLKGDSYLVVWPGRDGLATWFPNCAGTVCVSYDPENPGHILRAAKAWKQGKKVRLTLYYTDRLEKYVTISDAETLPLEASAFMRYVEKNKFGQTREPWPLPNLWNKVPVFHLASNAPIGKRGRGELDDIKAPQDGANKAVMDMMVGMEFNAYPQRWATNIELPIDEATGKRYLPFKAGVDELWHAPNDANFGEFGSGDMEKFIAVKRSFMEDMAMISRVPLHYFTLKSGDVPSGEALEMLETPLSSKVEDRQASFGGPLEDAMRFSLEIEGIQGASVETDWADTTPRSRASVIATLVQKLQLGISKKQAQREAGYSPSQIARMASESSDEASAAGDLMGGLFNAGAV